MLPQIFYKIGFCIGQKEKTRKECAAEVCVNGIKSFPKRSIVVPCWAETDLVLKGENSINRKVFQLLALAVGHGQLPKPQKNVSF